MTTKQERLERLLTELFQLDDPDLDFGLYRLMRGRRGELTAFLRHDLFPQIAEALAGAAGDEVEGEVFDHLHAFFRRYYADGDFLARRVYRPGVYAIPYEGEETTLYWANADQYYVKSGEVLRDYAFVFGDGDEQRRVRFRVADAQEGEHGNLRSGSGRGCAFLWQSIVPVGPGARELEVRFRFGVPSAADWPEGAGKKRPPSQRDLVGLAVAGVLAEVPPSWSRALAQPYVREDGTRSTRGVLETHLRRFTGRHSSDSFIHKHLAAFLERELDFYVKNEVLHLDDLEGQTAAQRDTAFRKAGALRALARKIIAFLAQREELKKRLWLKKKLVVDSHVCVTLDRVPEALLPAVAANTAQREAWVRSFAIDELRGNPPFCVPLSVAFLKAHPHLPVDTSHFDERFEEELLEGLDRLDEQWSGVLVHGDNFQASRLLARRYEAGVKCAYLDPPYNTSEETFVYKNNYRHSSWLSMMRDRLEALSPLMRDDGIVMVTIDDEEAYHLKLLLDGVFGARSYVGTVVVQSNPRGRGINTFFATSHEYCLCYAMDPAKAHIVDQPLSEEQARAYGHVDGTSRYRLLPFRRSGGLSTPAERPNSEYAIYYARAEARIVAVGGPRLDPAPLPYECAEAFVLGRGGAIERVRAAALPDMLPADTVAVLPVDVDGGRRVWRWADRVKVLQAARDGELIAQQAGERVSLMLKDRVKAGRKAKTVWWDARFDASAHGTNVLKQMLGQRGSFGYPKSVHATRAAIHAVVGDDPDAVVMDLFGGSGTTAQAVLELNRQDGGRRQFVVVEAESYFDGVLLPRVLKAAYCPRWQGGKPDGHDQGVSLGLKVLRLESYEDTLNNLVLERSPAQQSALDDPLAAGPDAFREQYLLERMLDVETRASAPMLPAAWLRDPAACKLEVRRARAGTRETVNVDLAETFNLLLGLRVERMFARQSFSAAFEVGANRRVRLAVGPVADPEGAWWFRMVTGKSPDGARVVVIWRKLTAALEQDNAVLSAWFERWGEAQAGPFDVLYVNGDNPLRASAPPSATWRSLLIEEELRRRVFDEEGG